MSKEMIVLIEQYRGAVMARTGEAEGEEICRMESGLRSHRAAITGEQYEAVRRRSKAASIRINRSRRLGRRR